MRERLEDLRRRMEESIRTGNPLTADEVHQLENLERIDARTRALETKGYQQKIVGPGISVMVSADDVALSQADERCGNPAWGRDLPMDIGGSFMISSDSPGGGYWMGDTGCKSGAATIADGNFSNAPAGAIICGSARGSYGANNAYGRYRGTWSETYQDCFKVQNGGGGGGWGRK